MCVLLYLSSVDKFLGFQAKLERHQKKKKNDEQRGDARVSMQALHEILHSRAFQLLISIFFLSKFAVAFNAIELFQIAST